MGHLKKFNLQSDYESFRDENKLAFPNVSLIGENGKLFYHRLTNNYYQSFDLAIEDINNGNVGKNAQLNLNEETVCNVFMDSGLNIFLYKDIISNKTLDSNFKITLLLNNKTIKSFTDTFIITNNDIFIKDGIINCFPQNYDSEAYCLLLNGGNGIINNVTINTKSNGGGVMENPTTAIRIKSHSILNIENSTFNGVDENNGSISNVYVEELCELNCINTKFEATSPNGMSANIFSQGDIILSSCDVQCYANHTANAAGTNYATLSRAIYSVKGNVKLFDCQIYGTHSGLTIRDGELYVDGGTYDGYSHGGIYFGSNNTKNYIYNASVNDTPIRGEGMYDDGVAGTNGAGMYIGGGSFMEVYVDNCNFYGKIQPIVIKYNSSSSHDNQLFVSNSTINLDYTRCGIRNDGANYVKFGVNNNFSYLNLENKRNYEITDETYYMH